jgi:hypothetical protein
MVDCTVGDRSHVPSHPHIAKIDGDEPVDNEAPAPVSPIEAPTGSRQIGRAELPDWLKDKPGAQVIRPATSVSVTEDPQLCQVCGEQWAPKHACKGAEAPETDFNRLLSDGKARVRRGYARMQPEPTCDVCGLIKRSNHNCKGQPKTAEVSSPAESVRTAKPWERSASSTVACGRATKLLEPKRCAKTSGPREK